MRTFRIGIDCRLSGNTHAGIGRYIENLITRLPLDTNIQWVLFFYDQSQIPTAKTFQNALTKGVIKTVMAPVRHYTLAEQLQMPAIFAQQKLDLLHVPHFNLPLTLPNDLKIIVTIHDLLWHEQRGMQVTTLPSWKYWPKYFAYKLITRHTLHRAKTILVPSNAVKSTIKEYYPSLKTKIVVTYEGADQHKTSHKSTQPLLKNTLLYVGSLYPHKNVKLVLQALQKNKDLHLEIAGSRTVFQKKLQQQAKQLRVEERVGFLGFVSDQDLLKKYQSSLALVQPSLSEGFGLTGLEAMSAGGCVLASDTPIFKEIYQRGAIYFDPNNVESLLEKISYLQKLSSTQRAKQLATGQKIAMQYSWETMVEKTIDQYLQLLST